MNTPGSTKSFVSDPGRPPRTPIIAERYNMSEPPLSTRLEKLQSTPRLQIKTAPKIVKSLDRRTIGGRSIMESPLPQIVTSSPVPVNLSRIYRSDTSKPYIDQVFQLKHMIGEGSFGKVFCMESLEKGGLYAVKCSQQPYRNKRNRQERLHEVWMHERIPRHENLVEFISAWEESDLLYIQLELCEKSLLRHLYDYAPLPEWRVWDILLDLTKAVYHLDKLNIIHVDIKPDNVLIGFDGVCKLCDFGMMVDLNTEVVENELCEGDSKYLAREVLTGHATKESCIFSLGLSILQIATDLYLPSSGDRWHDIRDLKIDARFTEHLTPELVNLIYRMMATEAQDRPTIEQILFSQLLQEHDTGFREWNKTLYPMFKNLTGMHDRLTFGGAKRSI